MGRLYPSFSNSLEKQGRTAIGLWLENNVSSSFLCIGVIKETLSCSGIMPVERDSLYMTFKGSLASVLLYL